MKTLNAFLFLAMAALPVLAQEDEDAERSVQPIMATVAADTRVHSSPAGASVGTLRKGAEARVVGINDNGWVRVRTADGKGWVDRHFLRSSEVTLTSKNFSRAAKKKTKACANDLAHCGTSGCADEGEDHGVFNQVKHGPGSGEVASLPLSAFAKLQSQATQLVGEGADLTADERESIRDLDVGSATTGEGHLVTTTGFIVGAPPHANTGESVNCNLTKPADNDFHINLAPKASQTAFDGIVVEMIPQDRNDGWTLAKLKKVQTKKQRVMVTGQLFYDNAHRVNKNPQHDLKGEPKRFALWEIHPIKQFLVCTSGHCSNDDPSQWTKLQDLD
jgi:hypothetical protein